MNLNEKLKNHHNNFSANAPEHIKMAFSKASKELLEQEIEKKALNTGDIFPEFNLMNAVGKEISSKDLLSKGNLILSFYRGGW